MEKKTNASENANQKRIKKIHDETGLSFDKLAKITGFNRNTLAAWAKGRRQANDMVTNEFEARVSAFLNGGCEYINKTAHRERFRLDVQEIVSEEEQVNAIMSAFDNIPITLIAKNKGRNENGKDQDEE